MIKTILFRAGLMSLILFGFYTLHSASSTREALQGCSFIFVAMMVRLCAAVESK